MEKFANCPSIIPSMDVDLIKMGQILNEIKDLKTEIGGIKIGSLLVWNYGFKKVISDLRAICDFPVIFDAQKGGTDIPSIVEEQVKLVADAGIDAFIACPMGSGYKTLEAFVDKSFNCGITPIVLLEMTHPLANSFLKDNVGNEILARSLDLDVEFFVAPGNNPQKIAEYKNISEFSGKKIKIFSPGLGAQGGNPEEAVRAGTDYFILGRSIYEAEHPRAEVIKTFETIKRSL